MVIRGTLEVTQYYNNLKILWQELDMYYEADWGEGKEHTKFMAHLKNECLYEFLTGLNRELDKVCGQIMGGTFLPTIGEVFAEVRREEKRQLVMLGDLKESKTMTTTGHRPTKNSAFISKGPQLQKPRDENDSGSTRPWCSHCNCIGHTKEKCFKLHGYLVKNQKDNKATLVSSNTFTAADKTLDVRLTKNQIEALHKILGTTTAQGSLATQGTALNSTFEPNNQSSWILDSGASDHMIGNSTLFQTYTPCHNQSRIHIADGSYSPVAVLYVPNLSCNLLSISKLTKDESIIAEFSTIGYVVQEQKSGKTIGTAIVDEGLYIWNKDSGKEGLALSISKEDTIMLWHRRLGHPNFLYLKKHLLLLFRNKNVDSLKCEIY
ncbi:hypothetical protein V6Z12_A04G098800 [Gossypium hirsutum]